MLMCSAVNFFSSATFSWHTLQKQNCPVGREKRRLRNSETNARRRAPADVLYISAFRRFDEKTMKCTYSLFTIYSKIFDKDTTTKTTTIDHVKSDVWFEFSVSIELLSYVNAHRPQWIGRQETIRFIFECKIWH